jgi:hypothetical protein
MAQKVIVPQKKIMSRSFLNNGTLIVIISLKKYLVSHMLSHRRNVRTSKFWQKSKEKKRIFFLQKFTKCIKGFDLGQQKNSKLSHACVPLTN